MRDRKRQKERERERESEREMNRPVKKCKAKDWRRSGDNVRYYSTSQCCTNKISIYQTTFFKLFNINLVGLNIFVFFVIVCVCILKAFSLF